MGPDSQPGVHVRASDEFGRFRMSNSSRLGLAKDPHRHGMSEQSRDHLLSQACLLSQLCK